VEEEYGIMSQCRLRCHSVSASRDQYLASQQTTFNKWMVEGLLFAKKMGNGVKHDSTSGSDSPLETQLILPLRYPITVGARRILVKEGQKSEFNFVYREESANQNILTSMFYIYLQA